MSPPGQQEFVLGGQAVTASVASLRRVAHGDGWEAVHVG